MNVESPFRCHRIASIFLLPLLIRWAEADALLLLRSNINTPRCATDCIASNRSLTFFLLFLRQSRTATSTTSTTNPTASLTFHRPHGAPALQRLAPTTYIYVYISINVLDCVRVFVCRMHGDRGNICAMYTLSRRDGALGHHDSTIRWNNVRILIRNLLHILFCYVNYHFACG